MLSSEESKPTAHTKRPNTLLCIFALEDERIASSSFRMKNACQNDATSSSSSDLPFFAAALSNKSPLSSSSRSSSSASGGAGKRSASEIPDLWRTAFAMLLDAARMHGVSFDQRDTHRKNSRLACISVSSWIPIDSIAEFLLHEKEEDAASTATRAIVASMKSS